jgi:hypothetical protein
MWSKHYVIQALIVVFILLVISIFVKSEIIGITFFVLAFTSFDVFGYGLVFDLHPENKPTNDPSKKYLLVCYRVLQNMFFLSLLGLLYCFYYYPDIITGKIAWYECWAVYGCLVAWWMTFCDYLYYILLNSKTPEEQEFINEMKLLATTQGKTLDQVLESIKNITDKNEIAYDSIAYKTTHKTIFYYLFFKGSCKGVEDFYWLKGWSIFLIYKLFGWKISRTSFIIFAYLGLILAVGVCVCL